MAYYDDRDMDRSRRLRSDHESQIPPDDQPRDSGPGDRPDDIAAEAEGYDEFDQVSYEPLKEYDPQTEFGFIEQLRDNVDQTLSDLTSRFISKIIHIYVISAIVMAWTTVVMPILVWMKWPLSFLHPYAIVGLIIGPPVLLLIGLFAWRLLHVRIRLKWARFDLKRFVADKVALRLNEDNGRWSGAIDGMGSNSEMALLELIRIRQRAFHTWQRISAHTVLMSMRLRGPLETRQFSPRFFAVVLPVIAILFFLAYNIGATSIPAGKLPEGASAWQTAFIWSQVFWANISKPAVNFGFKPHVPLSFIFLVAFVLAYRSFHNAKSIHGYIMLKIDKTLKDANKLKPFSHDCSRRILHKHHLLLRLFTRMMWYGRHGGGGSVRDMFEDLQADMGDMGMDFELSERRRQQGAPSRGADGQGREPLTRISDRRIMPWSDYDDWEDR